MGKCQIPRNFECKVDNNIFLGVEETERIKEMELKYLSNHIKLYYVPFQHFKIEDFEVLIRQELLDVFGEVGFDPLVDYLLREEKLEFVYVEPKRRAKRIKRREFKDDKFL